MANTLTYDPTPENEILTEEEQDSLRVGEQLAEENEQLLAGKFRDAEELERAYNELQKKLGSNEPEEEQEVSEEEQPDEELPEGVGLITDASQEFFESGELSEETLSKFNEMSSGELVEAYMAAQRQAGYQPQVQQEVADLSDQDINVIKNSVGGEAAYSELTQWAAENMPQQDVEAFDALVSSGNATAIRLAVQGMLANYQYQNGYEGRMLSGKDVAAAGDVFRSQAEVVRAMEDPRYDNDPAYRQDVFDKLERSNVSF